MLLLLLLEADLVQRRVVNCTTAKGVEKLCEGAWLEGGPWGWPGWFMTGSGLRERKVGEVSYRSRSARNGGQNTRRTKWQRGADLKRVVRGCLESAGLRVVRTKAA